MDPVRIRNWALAATACAAVVGPTALYVRGLVAQEARKEAQKEVQVEMVPVQAKLNQLVEGQRRDEDFKRLTFCLDREHQDLPAEQRQDRCKAESEHRWATWAYEDCVASGEAACAAPPPIPWRQ